MILYESSVTTVSDIDNDFRTTVTSNSYKLLHNSNYTTTISY